MSQILVSPPPAERAASPDLVPHLLRVAWMGVLLGLAIESLVLLALGLAGKLPPPLTIAADTMQKVTWSTLVCAALAAAQTLLRAQALGMAAAGLLGAPVALLLARSVHKAVNAALDAAPAAQTATPWLLAGTKGVEYALLGLLLIRLAKRSRGLAAHAGVGAGLGLAFFLRPGLADAVGRIPAAVDARHQRSAASDGLRPGDLFRRAIRLAAGRAQGRGRGR